jgi:hypothetical protein
MIARLTPDIQEGVDRLPRAKIADSLQAFACPTVDAFLESIARFGGVHYKVRNDHRVCFYPDLPTRLDKYLRVTMHQRGGMWWYE